MSLKNEGIHVYVRVRPPISDDISYENAVYVGNNTISLSDNKHNVSCSYGK